MVLKWSKLEAEQVHDMTLGQVLVAAMAAYNEERAEQRVTMN